MMAMVGNGSYGLVMGGRKKEIREEVLVSVFSAFVETFMFGMLFQKLLGTQREELREVERMIGFRENGLQRQRERVIKEVKKGSSGGKEVKNLRKKLI